MGRGGRGDHPQRMAQRSFREGGELEHGLGGWPLRAGAGRGHFRRGADQMNHRLDQLRALPFEYLGPKPGHEGRHADEGR